jgi:hypothetical protein
MGSLQFRRSTEQHKVALSSTVSEDTFFSTQNSLNLKFRDIWQPIPLYKGLVTELSKSASIVWNSVHVSSDDIKGVFSRRRILIEPVIALNPQRAEPISRFRGKDSVCTLDTVFLFIINKVLMFPRDNFSEFLPKMAIGWSVAPLSYTDGTYDIVQM